MSDKPTIDEMRAHIKGATSERGFVQIKDTAMSKLLVFGTILAAASVPSVMKASGLVSWSWLAATSPLWVPLAIALLVLLLTGAFGVLAWAVLAALDTRKVGEK